jgi:ABC-type transport system substrate-binding protein
MTSYWASVAAKRISRRRAIATTSGLAVGAGLLAACGWWEDDENGGNDLVYVPKESSKVTKGGVFTDLGYAVASFTTVGPLGTPDSAAAAHGYSRLVKQKAFKYPDAVLPEVAADAAASWEISPDGLTYTFKIRPGFKFDSRPPTNGRVMTSADVRYSWEKFAETNAFRSYVLKSVSPDAPIVGFETPDPSTVVFKLASPLVAFLSFFTWDRVLTVMPVEAEDKFDPKTDMRGTGAWRLKEYRPSTFTTYVPNPDWYDAAKVNFSELTYYDLPEYAAQLSQFTAGNLAQISSFGRPGILQHDVLPTKQRHPSLLLKPVGGLALYKEFIRFGYQPGSPFLDERVRRAASMLLDRDLIIDTINETKAFTDAGLEVEKRWGTVVPAGWQWWLDPKGKEFGSDAKVFTFDPAEAKKLLSAAGHSSPIKTPFAITTGAPIEQQQEGEILANMIGATRDFDLEFKKIELAEWRFSHHFGADKHEGMGYGFFGTTFPDIDIPWFYFMLSGGLQSGHVGSDGKPDATLDGLFRKQRVEADSNRRLELMKEIQRYYAQKMYTLAGAGDSTRFELAQPWLGNWGVYRTFSPDGGSPANELYPYMFIDSEKKRVS